MTPDDYVAESQPYMSETVRLHAGSVNFCVTLMCSFSSFPQSKANCKIPFLFSLPPRPMLIQDLLAVPFCSGLLNVAESASSFALWMILVRIVAFPADIV